MQNGHLIEASTLKISAFLKNLICGRGFGSVPYSAVNYCQLLHIEALTDGPEVLGAKAREDIAPGICTLHVARQGRKGRYFVIFRQAKERTIDVLRLLHDSVDLARHISDGNDQTH